MKMNITAAQLTELEMVLDKVNKGDITRIIVLTGAGISCSAGIPDFRSPGGLYETLAKQGISDPTSLFTLSYFKQHPEVFYSRAKELYPDGRYRPTRSHQFIRLLETKSRLLRNYTQNIDGLETISGLNSELLVQAHGGFESSSCTKCRRSANNSRVREAVDAGTVARCDYPECNGAVKPDIVFFEENLPTRFNSCVREDFKRCELLIVMGTSLKVEPFASLVDQVAKGCPRILLNNEPVGPWAIDARRNTDIYIPGATDRSVTFLARRLDWMTELFDLEAADRVKVADKMAADKRRSATDVQTTPSQIPDIDLR
jgi:NAD-dependent SIR2 family protein deacetylase